VSQSSSPIPDDITGLVSPNLFEAVVGDLRRRVDSCKDRRIGLACEIQGFFSERFGYEDYPNNKKSVEGTWNEEKGNCVDLSILLASLYRAAGFDCRLVTFRNGPRGHMSVEVYLPGDLETVQERIKSYEMKPGWIKLFMFSVSDGGWFLCDSTGSGFVGDASGILSSPYASKEGNRIKFFNKEVVWSSRG